MSEANSEYDRVNIRMIPPGVTLPPAAPDGPARAGTQYEPPAVPPTPNAKARRRAKDHPDAAPTYIYHTRNGRETYVVYMSFRGETLYLALRGGILDRFGGRQYLVDTYRAQIARFDYVANEGFVIKDDESVYVGLFIPFATVESMDCVAADPSLKRVLANARATATSFHADRLRGMVPPACVPRGRRNPSPPANGAAPVGTVPPPPERCVSGRLAAGEFGFMPGVPEKPPGVTPDEPITPGAKNPPGLSDDLRAAVRARLAATVSREEIDTMRRELERARTDRDDWRRAYDSVCQSVCNAAVLPTNEERVAALELIADELTR